MLIVIIILFFFFLSPFKALDKLDKKNKNFSGGYLIEKYARMGTFSFFLSFFFLFPSSLLFLYPLPPPTGKSTDLRFKTALKGKGTRDLSFSGIKSAVARHIFSLSPPSVSSPQESSPPRVASYGFFSPSSLLFLPFGFFFLSFFSFPYLYFVFFRN